MSDRRWAGSAFFLLAAELRLLVSPRWEFLAFCGILPDTYRAAPPRPGLTAGSLFAMTVVERGIEYVSSSYSYISLISRGHIQGAAYRFVELYLHQYLQQ